MNNLVLLKHGLIEIRLMRDGLDQNEAHIRATRVYNYSTEALAFYEKMGLGENRIKIRNKK